MELNELTQKIDIKWAEIQNLLKDYKAQQKPVLTAPTTLGKLSLAERMQEEREHFWRQFPRFKIQGTLAESEVSGDYRFKLENISLEAVHKIRKITGEDYKTSPGKNISFTWENRKRLLVVPQKLPSNHHPDSVYYFEMASIKKPKVFGLDNQSMAYEDLSVGDTVVAEISVVTYDTINTYSRPLHLTKTEHHKACEGVYDLLSLSEKYDPIDYYRRSYYGDWERAGTFTPIRAVYMQSIKLMRCKKDRDVL